MGDVATLAKARMELEELYLGIPDESVNLTFKDLAEVTQNSKPISEKKKTTTMEVDPESKTPKKGRATSPTLIRTPSLDFNKGLQASNHLQYPDHDLDHHVKIRDHTGNFHGSPRRDHDHHGHYGGEIGRHRGHAILPGHRFHIASPLKLEKYSGFRHVEEGDGRSSFAYDHQDVSGISMASVYQERVRRRRPGIPHSNICTVCSTYIYIFRHRCLVCGRAYCRQCVGIGMGDMTEGRKCLGCLGKRFSQRYIQRAGKVGWCWGYPSMVKPAELKWAEKGPKRSDERAYDTHGHVRSGRVMSRSPRSPITPRAHAGSNSPSFVAGSPYTVHTPTHHHLPF
ncbi:uncharacterized protein LOC121238953 [Juglans microcarpa x Juglans regia]|uniref:uncharacterized protein LOC121238953 n=1 Tax=Juglans microcarpa x Juglans regia TaxID=2249226 RepID=UPI001B7F2A48|nr:uncharacterized protein LOC121238953 [Juglans microcarpa x Juglans regia]